MYNIRYFIWTFILFTLICAIGVAQLGVPHQFYGEVNFLSGPAPDGSLVEAKIGGITVATTTTYNGKYGYAPNLFYIDDPNNDRAGKVIEFYVRGINTGETAIFQNGMSTRLDLSVNISLTCGDGTEYGKCSSNKPKYCDDGVLVDNCQKCGCPSGSECRADGKCYPSSPPSGGGGGGGPGYGARPKPSCFDGIQNCHDNACEEGIDCGGPCKPCPSCSDGIQNQGETGIDCGGPCKPCVTTTVTSTTSTTTTIQTTVETMSTLTEEETTTVKEEKTTVETPIVGRVIGATSTGNLLVGIVILIVIIIAIFMVKRRKKGEESE